MISRLYKKDRRGEIMVDTSTIILASFATLKNMCDEKSYKSSYQILTDFINYVITADSIHYFSAVEMKNRLHDIFGFDIPEAVVKSACKNNTCLKLSNGLFYVNSDAIKADPLFVARKEIAEQENDSIIKKLTAYVAEKDPDRTVEVNKLTQEFVAYLVDDQPRNGAYTDLISQFILAYEKDSEIQRNLQKIREGSILYIGLNYNINETGSIKKEIVLYLGTEILFSLIGYNGEIYNKLAQDFYSLVKTANIGQTKIYLRYFSDIQKEIDDFFRSAEDIAEGKVDAFDKVAMKSIVNGCSTAGDVRVKKADFYHDLEYTYGIKEDEKNDYYDTSYDEYNLESLENEPQYFNAAKFISNINKLRGGKIFQNNFDAEHLIVTNSGDVLRFSKKQVEKIASENSNEHICDFAVSLDRITNLLWYKLGNGFGQNAYPTNVNVVLKARSLLASEISQNIVRIYSETKAQFAAGKITKEQLASRILTLRAKPIVPEEIREESIEDDMNFSAEYLTRFEEEAKINRDAVQESKQKLASLIHENTKALAEKNKVIADQEQEIQNVIHEKDELETELDNYRKEKEQQEYKKNCVKNLLLLIGSILWKIFALVVIVFLTIAFCNRFGIDKSTAIGTLVGIGGLIPIGITVIKRDITKYFPSKKVK